MRQLADFIVTEANTGFNIINQESGADLKNSGHSQK